MALSLSNSILGLNSVLRSSPRSSDARNAHISSPYVLTKSRLPIKCRRRQSFLSVTENDRLITDPVESSNNLESIPSLKDPVPNPSGLETSFSDDPKLSSPEASIKSSSTTTDQENKTPSGSNSQTSPKKVPLTARERLRAARVLSRYSESKPAKSQMGRSVLDALRESEKGKKGLPEAPTNLFDDSKRGLPKPGLTFNFPGGFDLFLIALSFVLISTIMFATTFVVWKVGAIHFNEY